MRIGFSTFALAFYGGRWSGLRTLASMAYACIDSVITTKEKLPCSRNCTALITQPDLVMNTFIELVETSVFEKKNVIFRAFPERGGSV